MGSDEDVGSAGEKSFHPADLYRHVESWWGEPFDDKLAERMVAAPKEHQFAFSASLDDLKSGFVESLPEIPSGVLRPAVAPYSWPFYQSRIEESLALLLYAHEIVLDKDFLFESVDPARVGSIYDEPKEQLFALEQASRIRPLVEDESIRFASILVRALDAREATTDEALVDYLMRVPEAVEYLRWLPFPSGLDTRIRAFIDISYFGVIAASNLAASQRAHMLARDRLEQFVVRSLFQGPVIDNRQLGLQKLASLKVPDLRGNISTLVALRRSDADFAEWRTRLGEALTYVGELGDGGSLDEAAEVVYAQLSDGLGQVNRAVKRSPALQAAKGGLTALAIGGITGTTAEVVTNDPLVALSVGAAGGTTGMFLEAGRSYINALQERRKGRLILDVSMLFDPYGGDAGGELRPLGRDLV